MKKRILLLVLCMVFTLISCGKEVELKPSERVLEGVEALVATDAIDASFDMTFDIDADCFAVLIPDIPVENASKIFEMVNDFSVSGKQQMKYLSSEENFAAYHEYDLYYKKSEVFNLALAMKNEEMKFKLPSFSEKGFLLNLKTYLSMINIESNDQEFADFDYGKYIAIILEKDTPTYQALNEADTYHGILQEFLEENLSEGVPKGIKVNGEEVKVTEYTIDIDHESYQALLLKYIEAAKADEKLQDHMVHVAFELIKELKKSGDYSLFDITDDEIIALDIAAAIEIRANWDEFFTKMINSFNEIDASAKIENMDLDAIYDGFDMKISIDDSNMIKEIKYIKNYIQFGYDFTYKINHIGDEVVLEKIDDPTIDLLELMNSASETQMSQVALLKEFLVESVESLESNSTIKNLVVDISSLDETIEFDETMYTDSLATAKMYLSFFTDEQIREIVNDLLF